MNGKRWIVASISTLVILLFGLGLWWLISNYYHPLTLIYSINRQNVIGYVEWRKQDQALLFGDNTIPLPNLLKALQCTDTACSFSGDNNALVLRKTNNEPRWEYYVNRPNKIIFQANWDSLTKGQNELIIDQNRYRLYWIDELAIVSSHNPLAETEETVVKVDQMPWVKDKSWSNWGKFLAVGYCNRECLWYNWQNIGDQFPLLADFITDIITYSTFTIRPSASGPLFHYQLNYTASYHNATSVKPSITTIQLPQNAQFIFSGYSLGTTINDLLHDTQNKGLWKTIVDFGSQTPTGLLLEALKTISSDYPYTVSLSTDWKNTTLQLNLTAAQWQLVQEKIVEQAKALAPTLFPRKEVLTLPDSSIGYEWVKNTNLLYTWSPTTQGKSELMIKDARNNTLVTQIYTLFKNETVWLSLQPIKSDSETLCTLNQPYQEFNAWHHTDQYWLWSGITKRSISNEQGVIGWQKSIGDCVHN